MATKKKSEERVRRAIGPAFTDLLCPSCCNHSANGMVAVNGSLYVSCGLCRFKVFGLTPRSISGFRWLLKLVEKPGMVERLLAAQGKGVAAKPDQIRQPEPVEADQAPVEIALEGEAA